MILPVPPWRDFFNFDCLSATQRYRFGREEKLKSRKAIEQLFREGDSFSVFPFRVIWKLTETAPAHLQVGFTVSSKQFKKAVDRNRIKRLTREAWRLQKNELQLSLQENGKYLSVFFIFVGNELPDYPFLFGKTTKVIKRLIKIAHENHLATT